MITIVAAIAAMLILTAYNYNDVEAQPTIPNCPPGTHVELIAQDFTCIRDIPGQERKQVIPPVDEQRCIGCVNEPSPGIEGLKKDQVGEYQDPYQVKPGEDPRDEQHCIGCADMEAPSGDIEDTNIPELKK